MRRLGIYFPSGIGNALIFSDFLKSLNNKSFKIDIFVMQKGTFELFKWLTGQLENINIIRIAEKTKILKIIFKYDKFGIYEVPTYKSILLGMYASRNIVYLTRQKGPKEQKFLSHQVTSVSICDGQSEYVWAGNFVRTLVGLHEQEADDETWNIIPFKAESPKQFTVCVHAGCNSRADYKRWSVSNYVGLLNFLHTTYKAKILLIGSQDDVQISDTIQQSLKFKISNYVNKTTLFESGRLISHSSLFISGDSGMMHFCSKIGTPQIAIFNNITGKPKNIPRYVNAKSRTLLPSVSLGSEITFPEFHVVKENLKELINEILE